MEDDEECNTGLRLALGLGNYVSEDERQKKEKKSVVCLDLSFTLYPKEKTVNLDRNTNYKVEEGSSFKAVDDQEDEIHGKKKRRSSGDSKSCENDCGSRKKLRLTKEQSSLLEHSFKLHSTLNPAQKQALAERLNLKPRQVEVWFQNRRARTKLKQTEVDCELLKKCCESLSDENRRLKKELQELRYLKLIGRSPPPPLYLHLPNSRVPTSSTTLTLCPSCEKTPSGSCEEEQEENVSICKSNNNKLQGGLGGTPTN